MGYDLSVSFGAELVSHLLQPLLQREKVLDDAVVNDDHLAGAIAVRMGVVLVRLSMRGPPRVAHPERSLQRRLLQLRFEVAQFSFRAHDIDAVSVHDGDPRAVIAAVFEFLQSGDQDRHDVTPADVSDDSAHVRYPLSAVRCPLEFALVKRLGAAAPSQNISIKD